MLAQLTSSLTLFAQDTPQAPIEGNELFSLSGHLGHALLYSLLFTLMGVILFAVCLWLIVKIAPFSIRKEIEEDQNTSLGIIIGSMILGLAIILAAAIHGG